jgi:hypothetical protein
MVSPPPGTKRPLAWTQALAMVITALQLLLTTLFMSTNGEGSVGGQPVERFPPAVVAVALIVIIACCVALFAGWAIGHGARWSLWTLTGFNTLWLAAVVVAPYAYIRDSTLRGGWELIGYAAFFGGPGLIFGLTSLVLVLRILLNPTRFQLFQ